MDIALGSKLSLHPRVGECFDLYELLDVAPEATDQEIKRSYRKQALVWHPDKNVGNAEAAQKFTEIVAAYEILSDPKEREWYDENREQMIGSDNGEGEGDSGDGGDGKLEVEPTMDLDQEWCNVEFLGDVSDGPGSFFCVFSRVFTDVHEGEETAHTGNHFRPGFGWSTTDLGLVKLFYDYWLCFKSTRSFASFGKKWDVGAAPNKVVRQLMQQKNRIEKEKARNQFNEQVRRLAAWVQSVDPRVEAMKGVSSYMMAAAEGDARGGSAKESNETFHCAACKKRFKSAKQMKNHEESTKHKQAAAALQKLLEDAGLEDLASNENDGGGGGDGTHSAREVSEETERGGGNAVDVSGGGAREGHEGGVGGPQNSGEGLDTPEEAAGGEAPATLGGVVMESKAELENSEEYKSMNKTQRRKAMQQWEAEKEYYLKSLPAKTEKPPSEKKVTCPKKVEKKNITGGHNREFRAPKKKKAVFGGGKKGKGADETESFE